MGEYAIRKRDRTQIKIGTCEDMYYIRFEDRDKVSPLRNNVDIAAHPEDNRFRLPFPDEDHMQPGDYTEYDRSLPLSSKIVAIDQKPCDHSGDEITKEIVLSSLRIIKADDGTLKVFPVLRCLRCSDAWRYEWADVLPFIEDQTMRERLEVYANVQR